MTRTVLLLLTLTLALSAQGKGKGKGKPNNEGGGPPSNSSTNISVSVVFGDSDRRLIQQWAHAMPASGLPPGLAKRGQLPPGLQKQLRRNGTLPPGLQKQLTYFSYAITHRIKIITQGPFYFLITIPVYIE